MTENEQIGAKIKARRLQKGLTLKQLGDLTDLSVGFLSQAERGLTTISLNSLYRLATGLDTDVSFFFGEAEEEKRRTSSFAAMSATAFGRLLISYTTRFVPTRSTRRCSRRSMNCVRARAGTRTFSRISRRSFSMLLKER